LICLPPNSILDDPHALFGLDLVHVQLVPAAHFDEWEVCGSDVGGGRSRLNGGHWFSLFLG
jgi:hypothetical protein